MGGLCFPDSKMLEKLSNKKEKYLNRLPLYTWFSLNIQQQLLFFNNNYWLRNLLN